MDSIEDLDPTLPLDFENSIHPHMPAPYMELHDGSIPLIAKTNNGQLSPIRARTMKEYDQQLCVLKKENFDLKLRIFHMKQQKHFMDGGNVYNTNVELNLQVENMKQEIEEKAQLLQRASAAIQTLSKPQEDRINKLESDHKTEVEQLKMLLESQINSKNEEIQSKDEKVEQLETDNEDLKQQLAKHQDEVADAEQTLCEKKELIELQTTQLEELRTQLQLKLDELATEKEELQGTRGLLKSAQEHQALSSSDNKQLKHLLNQAANERARQSILIVTKLQDNCAELKDTICQLEKANEEKTGKIKQRDDMLAQLEDMVHTRQQQLQEVKAENLVLKEEMNAQEQTGQVQLKMIKGLISGSKDKDKEMKKKDVDYDEVRKVRDNLQQLQDMSIHEVEKQMEEICDRDFLIKSLKSTAEKSNDKVQRLEENLRREKEHCSNVEGKMNDAQVALEQCQGRVKDKDKLIQQLTENLTSKDAQIQQYLGLLKPNLTDRTKDDLLQKLQEKITGLEIAKEKQITEHLESEKCKDTNLMQLQQSIRDRDSNLARANALLQAAQETIQSLETDAREATQEIKQLSVNLKKSQMLLEEERLTKEQIINEKDAAVNALQERLNSLGYDMEESLNKTLTGDDEKLAKLHEGLAIKDKMLEDVIAERNRVEEIVRRTQQEMKVRILQRDGEYKDLHDKYISDTQMLEKKYHDASNELGKLERQLLEAERVIGDTEQRMSDLLKQHQSILTDKDRTIDTLVESSQEKDKLLHAAQNDLIKAQIELRANAVTVGELKRELQARQIAIEELKLKVGEYENSLAHLQTKFMNSRENQDRGDASDIQSALRDISTRLSQLGSDNRSHPTHAEGNGVSTNSRNSDQPIYISVTQTASATRDSVDSDLLNSLHSLHTKLDTHQTTAQPESSVDIPAPQPEPILSDLATESVPDHNTSENSNKQLIVKYLNSQKEIKRLQKLLQKLKQKPKKARNPEIDGINSNLENSRIINDSLHGELSIIESMQASLNQTIQLMEKDTQCDCATTLQKHLEELRACRERLEQSLEKSDSLNSRLHNQLTSLHEHHSSPETEEQSTMTDNNTQSLHDDNEMLRREKASLQHMVSSKDDIIKELKNDTIIKDKQIDELNTINQNIVTEKEERILDAVNKLEGLKHLASSKEEMVIQLKEVIEKRNEEITEYIEMVERDKDRMDSDTNLLESLKSENIDLNEKIDVKNAQLEEMKSIVTKKEKEMEKFAELIQKHKKLLKHMEKQKADYEELVMVKKEVEDLKSAEFDRNQLLQEKDDHINKLRNETQELTLEVKEKIEMLEIEKELTNSMKSKMIEYEKTYTETVKNIKEKHIHVDADYTKATQEINRLKETIQQLTDQIEEKTDLNRTLKFELDMHDQLTNGASSEANENILIELLNEIKNLRVLMEKCIQSNNNLRSQVSKLTTTKEDKQETAASNTPSSVSLVDVRRTVNATLPATESTCNPPSADISSRYDAPSHQTANSAELPELKRSNHPSGNSVSHDRTIIDLATLPETHTIDDIITNGHSMLTNGHSIQVGDMIDGQEYNSIREGVTLWQSMEGNSQSTGKDFPRTSRSQPTLIPKPLFPARPRSLPPDHTSYPQSLNNSMDISTIYPEPSRIPGLSVNGRLVAVTELKDYELLKRENELSRVSLSGLIARIKDRLTTLRQQSQLELLQNMEYSTMRELSITAKHLEVCLTEETKLISEGYSITEWPLLDSQHNQKLIDQNEVLRSDITELLAKYKDLTDYTKAKEHELVNVRQLNKRTDDALCYILGKVEKDVKKAYNNLIKQQQPSLPAPEQTTI